MHNLRLSLELPCMGVETISNAVPVTSPKCARKIDIGSLKKVK